jgi:mRNA-degrading endonuclease RelE of RelBE toxin-antitoxin system
MEPYSVYIHLELLDIVPRRGDQRTKIINFIRSLADSPYTPGDFADQDTNSRTRQVKIIGKYAVTYWVDDPVKAVMVVGIQVADR